jgi:hypothetical protein
VEASKNKIRRYWYLPVIMIAAAAALIFLKARPDIALPQKAVESGVRDILWNMRQVDLYGQIVIILAGTFGIVILFKEIRKR